MSDIPTPRANPMIWDDPQAEGVLAPLERDALSMTDMPSLLGMPSAGMGRKDDPLSIGTAATNAALLAVLAQVTDALKRASNENRASRISLDHLSQEEQKLLFDALGEGEVNVLLTPGDKTEGEAQINETALPGVWHGRAFNADRSVQVDWLEVADAPLALRKAAVERPRLQLDTETIEPPRGAMNVMSVLSEIDERSRAWTPETPTHVLNFTLFPMTPADSAFLSETLGQVGVQIMSGGYGVARVIMTAVPHIWAVQYLNGMGTTILDTIEIGDIPGCILAAAEDFQDSAERIERMQEAYRA